jgi:hypothetical protein
MGGQPESTSPSEKLSPSAAGRSRCSGCPVTDCPAEDEPEGPLLAGWQLGLVSLGLFLGPVVLAIAGAFCGGDSPAAQLAGAIAGLGLGAACSVGIAKILHRGREKAG